MGMPYVGEVRMVGFNFAPKNWAFCDGTQLPIQQNVALFSVLGTAYGGDGQQTFNLPNLLGRVPMHFGNGFIIGEAGGSETVTLTTAQMPDHVHPLDVTTSLADTPSPSGDTLAVTDVEVYVPLTNPVAMANATTQAGGGVAHDNIQPYACINFIISTAGVFPSKS